MAASIRKVTEQLSQLERHYQPLHDHMRHIERMVEQRYDGLIDVPYEVRIFRSSTSANIVSGFRNQIRTHEPTVNFTPFGLSKPALKHGTLMQRWGYSMLKRERDNGDMDPNLKLALDLISRGAACKKIIVDVDQMMQREWMMVFLKLNDLLVSEGTSHEGSTSSQAPYLHMCQCGPPIGGR